MNKVYLIYGDEDYFIDKEISKLKKIYCEYDLINYNMLEDNISLAVDEASMVSLFSTSKLIICRNCLFLTGSKCDIDHNTDVLLDYLKSDSDCVLVLVVNSDSLDNRKKIVKELNKYTVIKCNKLKDYELSNFIIDYCKSFGFKINSNAVKAFLDKLSDNLYILTSELDKMFIYKSDKVITLDDVNLVTSKLINSNIFDLIDAMVKKDINKSLSIYDDLLLVNEEEIKLIVTIANQFRLIYQVKTMYKMGYSELDISKKLDVHPYRIKLARQVDVDTDECIDYLKRLSLLDEEIKSGKIDKKVGFQKFIFSL